MDVRLLGAGANDDCVAQETTNLGFARLDGVTVGSASCETS